MAFVRGASRDVLNYAHVRAFASFALVLALTGCAALSLTPQDARQSESHHMMGQSHLEQNRLQDAYLEFQKSVQANPYNKDSHNMLGYVHTRLGQYDEAIASYRQALGIDSSFSEAHTNMSYTYMLMGRWDDAIRSGEKALLNPLYATPENALNNIGFAQMKKGQTEEAVKTFKKALLRRPLPQASYNLALAYMALSQDQAALAELKSLIARTPKYSDAHYQLGMLYLRMGDAELAKRHLSEAARLAPDSEFGIRADAELKRLK